MLTKAFVQEILPPWLWGVLPENAVSERRLLALRRIAQAGEHLVLRALEASRYSLSYRPFPVGCAVLATNFRGRLQVFQGHNMKVGKEARVTCGEVIAVGSAMQAGFTHILALAVVGNAQPDQGSGLVTKTLHPCFRCRAELHAIPIVSRSAVILTATMQVAELLRGDTERGLAHIDPCTHEPLFQVNLLDLWEGKCGEECAVEVFTLAQLLALHGNHCAR